MKNTLLSAILISLAFSAFGQVKYNLKTLEPVPLGEVIDMSEDVDEFNASIKFTSIHAPGNTNLEDIKEEISAKFPKDPSKAIREKSIALPPAILNGFDGYSSSAGNPLDNHMAVSNDGMIISVINSVVTIKTSDGSLLSNRTLATFSGQIANGIFKFDPRVTYDPINDRFVFICLAGSASTTSTVVVGFSQTNDLTGDWNLYAIEGNPFNNEQWTDYPMIALTENELFLTINLIKDNVSWQEGFAETLIYQIDLDSGYEGLDLVSKMWSDITFNDKPIRNLCPVKYADETRGDNMFFLSNRNFDMTNDTFFVLEIKDDLNEPNPTLAIDTRITDLPYGVPPNAEDSKGFLQTNDARVLDAILIDDQIQFVGNTRNSTTGFVDVYHGIIEDAFDTKSLTGRFVGNVDYDLAYPGLAWTGTTFADKDVIIMATHSSQTKSPGITAVYFDNNLEYSELVDIKEGTNPISDGGTTRWGDYSGIQRKFNQPGVVYTAATYGSIGDRAITWINKLASPNTDLSSVEHLESVDDILVFPNPTAEKATLQFEVQQFKQIDIALYNAEGMRIKTMFKDHPKKIGLVEFKMDLTPLASGVYYLKASIGNDIIKTEKIIKL